MSLFADQRLERRVVIVTGSTQGLGQAIAVRAAELGAAGIVVCGRSQERGERVRRQLAELGTEALFIPADLADEQDCRAIVRACDERFGRLDGLVNSAGLTSRGTPRDTQRARWGW